MAYEKTVWVNGQAPALDAEHLNKMEEGISIGASDPMGPWKYIGKITDQSQSVEINIEGMGKRPYEVVHEVIYHVNNCKVVKKENINKTNNVSFTIVFNYKEEATIRSVSSIFALGRIDGSYIQENVIKDFFGGMKYTGRFMYQEDSSKSLTGSQTYYYPNNFSPPRETSFYDVSEYTPTTVQFMLTADGTMSDLDVDVWYR